VVGHRAAVGYDVSSHPAYHGTGDDDEDGGLSGVGGVGEEEEDTNYSYFDLNVDSIDVTLSLWRWLDGKGLVADAVVKGVRGVVGMSFLSSLSIHPNINLYSYAQTADQSTGTPPPHSPPSPSATPHPHLPPPKTHST
jgi:hypothetical protein